MSETLSGASYSKTKSRQGYVQIPARDPHDPTVGGQWDVLLSPELMESTKRRGMGRTRELIDSVREVLKSPAALFRGVRDREHEIDENAWLGYVGIPLNAYDYRRGIAVPPWPDQVVLVCVNDERVVYNWYWVKADVNLKFLPVDFHSRFRERVF